MTLCGVGRLKSPPQTWGLEVTAIGHGEDCGPQSILEPVLGSLRTAFQLLNVSQRQNSGLQSPVNAERTAAAPRCRSEIENPRHQNGGCASRSSFTKGPSGKRKKSSRHPHTVTIKCSGGLQNFSRSFENINLFIWLRLQQTILRRSPLQHFPTILAPRRSKVTIVALEETSFALRLTRKLAISGE